MGDKRPPQVVFTKEMRRETDEEKEAREKGYWPRSEGDADPSQLRLVPREGGPPRVYPFRMEMLGDDNTMAFFGKRREGKSFLMRAILHHKRDRFPRGYVFTNTKINGFWQQYFPADKVFKGYSAAVLMAIVNTQEELREWMNAHPDEAHTINPNVV